MKYSTDKKYDAEFGKHTELSFLLMGSFLRELKGDLKALYRMLDKVEQCETMQEGWWMLKKMDDKDPLGREINVTLQKLKNAMFGVQLTSLIDKDNISL